MEKEIAIFNAECKPKTRLIFLNGSYIVENWLESDDFSGWVKVWESNNFCDSGRMRAFKTMLDCVSAQFSKCAPSHDAI